MAKTWAALLYPHQAGPDPDQDQEMTQFVSHAQGMRTPFGKGKALGMALSLAAACLAMSPSAHAQAQDGQPQRLPTTTLGAGMYNIKVEVAQTQQEHATGLMWRTTMPANEGMLFIFPRAGQQCFWMKNTLLPLSIAFIDDSGRIVNLDEMQPKTENPHCSTQPVRFVLEMNKGWFKKHGFKPGDQIKGAPFGTPR
jgi:uncharacterized membrane protein (UPF0127 family)